MTSYAFLWTQHLASCMAHTKHQYVFVELNWIWITGFHSLALRDFDHNILLKQKNHQIIKLEATREISPFSARDDIPTLCDPMDYPVHGNLQAKILDWVAFPFSRGSFQSRDQTQVSCIVGGWATMKPKNTGVGSLLLLQWIFSTQESNWGLLHCRQILYQLSYQGSSRAPER